MDTRAYRRYLGKLYGNVDDCRFGRAADPGTEQVTFDGWADAELGYLRNNATASHLRRDPHLARSERLYWGRFRLTHPRLAPDTGAAGNN